MQGKPDLIRIKRKTFFILVTLLALGIATPVLADYLGPDRTTTTSEVDTYDYGVWARDNNKVPYCLDKKGNKADDCIVCEWKRKPGNACGDATYSYKLGTISEVVEKTINLPSATISSSLQNCSTSNGWCNTLPTLSLNGSEPLAGYNILAIEGSLNGQTFACSGSACDVPLNEGNNDFTFWALSSYGDSSEMGTLSAKVDTTPPNVGLDMIGSNGTNNWYVSPTTITAFGSDSTSGVSSVLLSVNSGAWTASATLNEGVHAVNVRAEDNAGNVSASSTTISVDTTTPLVDVSITGTVGSNGWYSSSMQVTATANDATSGVGSLESSLDGGVYQAYNSPVSFVDGYHTIQFKAVDKAGNETETSVQEFYVDTIAPVVDLPAEWEVNDTITYKVQDDGSGLSALRIVIEDEDEKFAKVAWDEDVSGDKFKGEITWNGKFKDGTIAPPGEYLVWVKAKDRAGNERFGLGRVIVPAPTSFFAPFSSPTVNNEETPLPPEELFDEGDSIVVTTTPQASFGGATVATQEDAQSSLSLVTGTASASTATNSNILWGATAAAMLGATMAYALEEKKKRKEQEQAQISEISLQREKAKTRANRDEEPPLTRQEKELAKQRKELQKIWDANGAAIYEANREYKAKHGKEMDGAARSKAIKDATMNGVFNAGAYASNLEAEKTRRDAQNERMANKMTRIEKEEEVRWLAQQKAAEEKRKAEELQAGYAAYYAATRQGEQEVANAYQTTNMVPLACTLDNPWGIPRNNPDSQTALDWLIGLYENDNLPGTTALNRTQWILGATENGPEFLGIGWPHTHFNDNLAPGDSGFDPKYQDSGLFLNNYSSNQNGHLLTALDFSLWAKNPEKPRGGWVRKRIALASIIGHEIVGDGTFGRLTDVVQTWVGLWANFISFGKVNEWFLSGEERNFEKIYNLGDPGLFEANRLGNSVADLRLSYQGWVAGEQLSSGDIQNPEEFSQWLTNNLK